MPARLRALRLLMGKDYKPLNGRAFAAEVGMSASTLRAVEAGRRSLSEEDLSRIKKQLGAVWNDDRNYWGCSTNPSIPWTKAFGEAFRAAVFEDPNQRDLDAETVSYQIWAIFRAIPAEQYLSAVIQFEDVLEEFAGRFHLSKRITHAIRTLAPETVARPSSTAKETLAITSIDRPDRNKWTLGHPPFIRRN